jgi:hypothetical protein
VLRSGLTGSLARTRRPGPEASQGDLDLSGFGSRTLHLSSADPSNTGASVVAAALEADKLAGLRQLVRRLLEILALWSILASEDFTGVCADLPDDARRALLQTPLIALATADDGVALAKRCVDKLLARFQGKPGQAPLSDTLHARCPTFHNTLDALKTEVRLELCTQFIMPTTDSLWLVIQTGANAAAVGDDQRKRGKGPGDVRKVLSRVGVLRRTQRRV